MKDTVFFSLLVPSYNSSSFIERCLECLLKQSFKNFELIIIDDGSTDDSGNICDRYAKKDTRINVAHQSNKGCVYSYNKLLRLARGQYVLFIDSDNFFKDNNSLLMIWEYI